VVRTEAQGRSVEDFLPEAAIESGIDEVTIMAVDRGGSAQLRELVETDGWEQVCSLEIKVTADVQWVSTTPSTFDADSFASLALNEDSGAPILQDYESDIPLNIVLTATLDPEHGWHGLEFEMASLDESLRARRRARPTRSEELLMELAEDEERRADS
jgi:hypothetical protein